MKQKFNKTGKSLLAFLLAAVMVFAMIPAVAVHAEAETSTYDVADFKGDKAQSAWTYPTETGKVFAGWFADAEYTTPFTATTGEAYAKFVDAGIMTVKKQFNTGATKEADTVNIRFLTAIKDTKLASVSFNVALASQSKSWPMTETTAYSSVLEEAGGVAVATDASSVFGSDATYFVVHTLTGIPNAVFGDAFTAAVSWVTLDGTVVTGTQTIFSVNSDLTGDDTEGDTCEHTGGTATCTTKATCTACGQPYGELNSENHEGETEVRDAKEATSTEDGYTGDTYCKACEKKIKEGETIPATNPWTTVSGYTTVKGFINVNGTVDRDNETSSSVTFTTSAGSADNQLLCQFADAAANVKAFEISTTVQPGATGRRGVGFKTPDGYLFFNVVENGGENGAGYVEFNVSNGSKTSQAYQALAAAAEAVITGTEPYTLKIVATGLTGTAADTITFYVNDIAVYTYTNTLGWNLTVKVLPAIGVRGSGASATFTDYTFRVQYRA